MAQLAYYSHRSSTSKVIGFVENLLLLLPKIVAGVEFKLAAGHSFRSLDENNILELNVWTFVQGFKL